MNRAAGTIIEMPYGRFGTHRWAAQIVGRSSLVTSISGSSARQQQRVSVERFTVPHARANAGRADLLRQVRKVDRAHSVPAESAAIPGHELWAKKTTQPQPTGTSTVAEYPNCAESAVERRHLILRLREMNPYATGAQLLGETLPGLARVAPNPSGQLQKIQRAGNGRAAQKAADWQDWCNPQHQSTQRTSIFVYYQRANDTHHDLRMVYRVVCAPDREIKRSV